tara:strand:- start:28 stop:411 length:384 start_codon:yes stop_codon:yes gene_type:complete
MSKSITSARSFPRPRPNKRPLGFQKRPVVSFPITDMTIDWDRLIDTRPLLLETLDSMPKYLLKPEVLAITLASFHDDGYDFGVVLKTLKQGAGRPSKRSLQRSPKRFIPILDRDFQTRIQSYPPLSG